ncbi:Protein DETOXIFICATION 16 (AtDTX16) (Multidrug and toxic compound extrusion protein 16) (MATE protein 16) [Durusdinium trenchii]|uniref:Protein DETOXIFICATION 16 (AtDTX16) (Multidrug and toxic compound extrusion protein 16) (MATE protein 16) n=1 Tax=Durusdinium trenchii TaxID=1381693 RepID=A0ABP0HHK8_9DINO
MVCISGVWREAWLQLRLALPVCGANLLQRISTWVTWIVVGRLGKDILGPVTLSSSVNNVLGTSVVGGLSVGVSTLASQAYGAGNDLAMALVLQRAIMVTLLGSIPCVILLALIRPILEMLGMEPHFCSVAGGYALTVLLVTPFMGLQRSIGTWLVAQKNNHPRMIVILIALPAHTALTVSLTGRWSYLGAGVAMTLSTGMQAILIYLYISFSSTCSRTWRGFSCEAFKDWGPFLEIALPGVWMNTEYFVGESLTLAASMLPDPDTCLSALSIYQLTQTTCYQIPSGLRMVISSRLGNQLGANQPEEAALGERLVLLWLTIPAVLLLVFTRQWGLLFTQNEAVLHLLDTLVWLLLMYSSLDALQAVWGCCPLGNLGNLGPFPFALDAPPGHWGDAPEAYNNGTLASCGQQQISGRWALRAYLGVSLPVGLLLAFAFRWGLLAGSARFRMGVDAVRGVVGLCAGHCLGKLCHVVPCWRALKRIDWEAEAKRAAERVEHVRPMSVALVR